MMGMSDKRPPSRRWVVFVVLLDAAAIDQTVYGWNHWRMFVPVPWLPAILLSVFTLCSWAAWSQPVYRDASHQVQSPRSGQRQPRIAEVNRRRRIRPLAAADRRKVVAR